MFCSNCGKEIEEGAKFCSSCGHQITQTTNAEPVAKKSILYTEEEPTIELKSTPTAMLTAAKARAAKDGYTGPVSVYDHQFKAKCEYCYTVFTYYRSNLDYRPWYPHGFVYCPTCKKPLRHSNDLLVAKYGVTEYENGEIKGEKLED